MPWSKARCSVCKMPGHNRTSCPQRRPLSPIVAASLTKEDAAKAFHAFYYVGDYLNPLSPSLRFLVLKTLCAFYLEEHESAEQASHDSEPK